MWDESLIPAFSSSKPAPAEPLRGLLIGKKAPKKIKKGLESRETSMGHPKSRSHSLSPLKNQPQNNARTKENDAWGIWKCLIHQVFHFMRMEFLIPAGKSCPKSAEGFSTWIRALHEVLPSRKRKKKTTSKMTLKQELCMERRSKGIFIFPFSPPILLEGGKRLGRAAKNGTKKKKRFFTLTS